MIEQNRAQTRKETEQGRTRIKTNQNRAGQGEAWSGHNRTKAGRLNHGKTLLEKNGEKNTENHNFLILSFRICL